MNAVQNTTGKNCSDPTSQGSRGAQSVTDATPGTGSPKVKFAETFGTSGGKGLMGEQPEGAGAQCSQDENMKKKKQRKKKKKNSKHTNKNRMTVIIITVTLIIIRLMVILSTTKTGKV